MVLVRFTLMLKWNLEEETQPGDELFIAKGMCEFLRGRRESTEVIKGKSSHRNWLKQFLAQTQPMLDHVKQDEEGYMYRSYPVC
jgi:hypothetical protein